MNIKIGEYQIYWLDHFSIGFMKHKGSSMGYVMHWSLWFIKIGIHKYLTKKQISNKFK